MLLLVLKSKHSDLYGSIIVAKQNITLKSMSRELCKCVSLRILISVNVSIDVIGSASHPLEHRRASLLAVHT